jgi:hypothetical protein
MAEELNHGPRIDRVEGEVQAIRGEMGTLTKEVSDIRSDVRGLGAILGRIEQSVLRAQERDDHREDRAKPNIVAIVSVLITMISIIVGGAWIISGQLAQEHERSEWLQRSINTLDQRMWDGHGHGAQEQQ